MGAIEPTKREKHKKTHRKKKKHKEKHVVHHEKKVDCGAWGCKCQLKPEKKKMAETVQKAEKPAYSKLERDYGNKKIKTLNIFGMNPKSNKLRTEYPRLYRWD